MRFFNTTGPVRPELHYCLPLATRLDENELRMLVEQQKYFTLHAPRQTGKTSTILNFVKQLNSEGKYNAVYVNVESAQAARGKYREGILIIVSEIKEAFKKYLGEQNNFASDYFNLHVQRLDAIIGNEVKSFLTWLSEKSEKPLVFFIDEIDSLVGDTLISILRQLRSGHSQRPKYFPQSVCLIGVRDVRDYRIWSEEEQQMVLGGSAFNIKAESLRLGDFTNNEVHQLYLQHTKETGQQFTEDAITYAFEMTQGQPWLVNALAYEACFKMVTDRSKPITKDIIEQAKEMLIKRRDTHLDVLVDRLEEPRVRNIVDAIISGNIKTVDELKDDDIQYARDLGIIKMKGLEIANPIYQEVLPRALSYAKQEEIIQDNAWYQNSDGTLDVSKLLDAFTEFYRENSADWIRDCKYKESGPHLLMMAFLQRVINGGGKIHREYALGRKRTDLLVEWRKQKFVIELKVYRNTKTLPEGLEQISEYMDTSGATEGHLVIFDKREKSWDEKIYKRQEMLGNKEIPVWGM